MSTFVIFAISLTIAYVIYYAVMTTKDLYGKKEENKSNEEVFDVSNITEEEATVAVNESDGGFSIANKQYDTRYQNGMGGDDGYGRGTAESGFLAQLPPLILQLLLSWANPIIRDYWCPTRLKKAHTC